MGKEDQGKRERDKKIETFARLRNGKERRSIEVERVHLFIQARDIGEGLEIKVSNFVEKER